ncbi:MAG: uroporphyrinogen decarboxylase [Deferribacteraceae bacterium]|jgi:uroporphyrinogen decarboxylase|nr:uroporphyrinogen decarboxylase [Deferribacteraceae bacterium]
MAEKTKFNDLLLKALSKERIGRPPVWLMRQAGRYMSEYRAVRSRVSFTELCKTPELACEVTLQPVEILGTDAAILFSDILIPLEPMGINLSFNPAPVIHNPVRTKKDADALTTGDPAKELPYVYETIRLLVKKLNVPLIGFSGAPFTLACYIVEGGGSKNFLEIKKLMHNQPEVYNLIMNKLTESTRDYLQNQIKNGCQVVQIFDTWAGILSPAEYREMVLPWVKTLTDSLTGAHVIYFVKDGATYFDDLKILNCSGMGLDWKIDIAEADKLLGGKYCLQGNLDPALLFTDKPTIKRFAEDIIEKGKQAPGHIFNLGHGIMPETPVENVKYLVDLVKGML